LAGTLTDSPVFGFRAVRAADVDFSNAPNFDNLTLLPSDTPSTIVSSTVATIRFDFANVKSCASATSLTISRRVIMTTVLLGAATVLNDSTIPAPWPFDMNTCDNVVVDFTFAEFRPETTPGMIELNGRIASVIVVEPNGLLFLVVAFDAISCPKHRDETVDAFVSSEVIMVRCC
jgi:hypothetical protein